MAIKIIYFEETLDNWGKKESSEKPERIHKALTSTEEWNDDMVFEGENNQIYFIDDLIGKDVEVEGFGIFQVPSDDQ